MIPLLYTDSGRVLGTVGLSSEDISDDFFKNKDLERVLSVDLFTWLPTHATVYVEPGALNPPALAKFNSDCLVLYCNYFCASKVLEAVLAIMTKESDGQNEYNRFANIDLSKLANEAKQQAGYYRQTLLAALQAPNVAVRVTQAKAVQPTYDPVTG
jgi:hypothetical protein